MSEEITISKSKFWKYATLLLVVAIIIVFFLKYESNGSNSDSGNSGGSSDSNAQKVVISYKNYNYYPNTIRVKVNVPVSITLDKSVQGCFREFVIPDFKIDKFSSGPSETIDFTPDKTGAFKFRCGMGMGTGIMIVE